MSKYDPTAKYAWEKSTPFTMNGNEFAIILNTFRTVLSSPEAQQIFLIQGANNAVEDVLKRNVESGAIKLAPEDPNAVEPIDPKPSMSLVKEQDTETLDKNPEIDS